MENFLPAQKVSAREPEAGEKQGEKSEARAQKTSAPAAANSAGVALRKLEGISEDLLLERPSPDGRYMVGVVPKDNYENVLYDLETGVVRRMGTHIGHPLFSPNGKQITVSR